MGLNNAKGPKQNWSKPVDAGDSWQDLLGLTQAQAAELIDVSATAVKDINDVHRHVFTAVHNAAAITLTDFAKMGIGSVILAIGLATPAIYVKKAASSPAVVGDWWLEALTQAT